MGEVDFSGRDESEKGQGATLGLSCSVVSYGPLDRQGIALVAGKSSIKLGVQIQDGNN